MSRRVSLEIIGCIGHALTRVRHYRSPTDGALFVQVLPDASLGLAIGSEAFLGQPAVDRRLGPRGWTTANRDCEGVAHTAAESLEREVSVAQLRALVSDSDPKDRTQFFEQARSLRVGRRRRSRDVP